MGCSGDGLVRCSGDDSRNWDNTVECMKELQIDEKANCYCAEYFRYFAEARGKAKEFRACCSRKSGATLVNCD